MSTPPGDGVSQPASGDWDGTDLDERATGVLLAEVSNALAVEAEPDRALRILLERLVPLMADWGTVRVRDSDGRARRVAVVHRDPAMTELLNEREHVAPFSPASPAVMSELFADRRARVWSPVEDSLLATVSPDPAMWRLWRSLGMESIAVIPLITFGEPMGSIILGIADPDRAFDPAHVAIAERLAIQCALLVKNTRLVREAEAAARGEADLRSLVDTLTSQSLTATVLLDRDLHIAQCNPAFAAIVADPSATDLRGAVPELADALLPVAAGLAAGGPAVDRQIVRAEPLPDGSRREYELSGFAIGDGSRGTALGLFLTDVTDERRDARTLRVSRARLDVSLKAGGLASWDWDFASQEVTWSDGAADILNVAPDAFGPDGQAFFVFVEADQRDVELEAMRAAARSAADYHGELRMRGRDGTRRWVEVRGRTVTDSQGRPRRMVGVAADITERRVVDEVKERLLDREHEARVEAEAARERLSLLVEAGTVLQGALDPTEPLEYIPDLVVPRVADWCVVDAIDDSGSLVQVALKHRDPERVEDVLATRLIRRDTGGDGIWSVRRAIRTGTSELVLDINDDDLVAAARDDEHLAVLRRLAPRSAIVTPLVARGRVLGGMTLVATHDRRFEPDDMSLIENLAGRAAMAVDNARLFESRSRVARALQQTLLPPALPEPGYVNMAARYRVAAGGIDIGGDFYDVYELSDGSLSVVVGDVCGRGPLAAAITGLFRHTLRAVSIHELEPAAILRETNTAILGQIDDTRFCTAALLRVRQEGGAARVTVACAGHPRPMVVRADGTVDRVEVAGPLLGVLPEPVLGQVDVDLGPGDAVVLYTDGVTEARRGGELFGESPFAGALATAAGGGPDALVDAVLAAVDAFDGRGSGDDIALLAVAAV